MVDGRVSGELGVVFVVLCSSKWAHAMSTERCYVHYEDPLLPER
jgi:hypothetical protein